MLSGAPRGIPVDIDADDTYPTVKQKVADAANSAHLYKYIEGETLAGERNPLTINDFVLATVGGILDNASYRYPDSFMHTPTLLFRHPKPDSTE